MSTENIDTNFFEETYYENRVWIASARLSNSLMMFTKPYIGEDDELGHISIKDLLLTLSESEMVPKYIAFWNNAVKLCIEESEVLSAINRLEKYGVKILVAGLALDKLKLKSSLRVGNLANNFDLIEAISQVQKVITF